VSSEYGFYAECRRRLGGEEGTRVWKAFNDCFDYMPLTATVAGSIVCMHGGLSEELRGVAQLRDILMDVRSEEQGLTTYLLWADPHSATTGWRENTVRSFLQRNRLQLVCRAHEASREGYEFLNGERTLVTVFSAPNYMGLDVMDVAGDLNCKFWIMRPDNRQREADGEGALEDDVTVIGD